jgi:glycosyltransferase involved in cell wall biosynthesis
MNESSSRVRNLLWVIDVDYSTRHHHGAMLRFRNYSKRLIASGRRVYWLVQSHSGEFHREREFFEQLRDEGAITDFFECSYTAPRWRTRLATVSILPGLGNRWLAPQQEAAADCCRELIRELGVDVCLIASRKLLFLAARLRDTAPVVVDFIDSLTLYHRRECGFAWKNRDLAGLLGAARYAGESYLKERYYARLADASIVVSPVDKQALDEVSGRPDKNHVLLNGVSRASAAAKVKKVPGRLIFSGNMDFPPNHKSALWFIDEVLPIILSAHPDTELVVAGANPLRELLDRASGHVRVTGFVEDMGAEIAASSLYVAPMIMGGGFKNKVVEALMNRTYVAATSIAVEFLGRDAADLMLVADSAEGLAQHISRFLSRPEEFDHRLAALHAMVLREFSWEHRTAELLDILGQVVRARILDGDAAPVEAVPSTG